MDNQNEYMLYRDPKQPADKRAEDLLGRMTLQEKVGQLNQRLYGFDAYERAGDQIRLKQETVDEAKLFGGLGVVYGLYRADPWSAKIQENGLNAEYAVRGYNMLQKCCLEHSRLGIPMLLSSECPHGHQALDGYLLPVNLAVGATFDPKLYGEAAAVCARQMKEMGVDLALVSALDVVRDPRWGRAEECYSEDPFLSAAFAAEVVENMQREGVCVVAKHFCAQGEGTGGVNASAARIGERELREIHLPAAKACCEAGVKGIMAAYNEIDGVYCHVNRRLLTDILRDEFGFEGIVMSDGVALNRLREMTDDDVVSAALALDAGVDVSLWDNVFPRLTEAVESGLVDEKTLDQAVLRVLKLKFEQGLFEHPYLEERTISAYSGREYPQSRILARESAVLLKNESLPFGDNVKTIAVIGPSADEIYRQLGDYTPPVEEEESYTICRGLRELAGDRKIITCSYGELTETRKQEVLKLLAEADAVVLALGGSSSRFSGAVFDDNGAAVVENEAQKHLSDLAMECGEGMDSSTLELPGGQMEWFRLAKASGRPLTTILIAGRAYAIGEIAEQTDNLLVSFYPGPYGGLALAELMYGMESPSGRLPLSFPVHAGQLPVYYNPKKSYDAMKYCDTASRPMFGFGEGFGYGKLVYKSMKLRVLRSEAEFTLEAEITVKNEGELPGWAVPQIYIHDLKASTVRRVRELKGFAKEKIGAGEERKITIRLPEKCFCLWNLQMKEVFEPGEFLIILADEGKDQICEKIML